MDIINDLHAIIADPSAKVDPQWLAEAAERYPYCVVPALMALKRSDGNIDDAMLARVAIAHPDRKALATQVDARMAHLAAFYPPEPEPVTPDTDTTIDRFLNSYGNSSDREIEALSQAIFNPMPDYADVLVAADNAAGGVEADSATSKSDQLINDYIAQSQQRTRQVAEQQPAQPATQLNDDERSEIAAAEIAQPGNTDDSMLSESLAKIYIARHNYSKALEIIKNISLKYPEKSVYFADQIRFLRKLELIQQSKNKQQ